MSHGAGGTLAIYGLVVDCSMYVDSLKCYIAFARTGASLRLSIEASELLRTKNVSLREQMMAKELLDKEEDRSTNRFPL